MILTEGEGEKECVRVSETQKHTGNGGAASSQQLCAAFSSCSRPGSQKPTPTQLLLLVAPQGLVTHPWSQERVGLGAAAACGGSCVRETCCRDFEAGVRREMEPDNATNENDLRKFFAQYGCVKEVKIVNDRAGVSKGYGFITFETQEDAQKILQEAEKLNYKDKKLNIGPAIRKQQVGISRSSIMPAAGTMYLTTSTGYPYTYHNGVAYFHTPEVASVPQPWPVSNI
ncbi:veficolin-1-like [Platysternon megacephalum]|uniref:Protein boule-like n=1 Tax=Platysternon megacephalum TaxID=55544 RepID=A0A4D9F785_9SAUR|nr:veficolin-1-like [Platysternon megacephalum]